MRYPLLRVDIYGTGNPSAVYDIAIAFLLVCARAVLDDYSILILSLRKSLQFQVWPYGNGDHDTISVIVFHRRLGKPERDFYGCTISCLSLSLSFFITLAIIYTPRSGNGCITVATNRLIMREEDYCSV